MEISTGNGNGIKLAEYKGDYSIISCREKDGKYYDQWATYQIGKDKHAEKDWPVKANLGDKDTATGALLMILKEITGNDYVVADTPF